MPGAAAASGGHFDRPLVAYAPLVPGAVVVGEIAVARQRQTEEHRGRGHAAVAVGDDVLPRCDARTSEGVLQLLVGTKQPRRRIDQRLTRQAQRSGDVAGAPASAMNAI